MYLMLLYIPVGNEGELSSYPAVIKLFQSLICKKMSNNTTDFIDMG